MTASTPVPGSVAWFEIGTDDPDRAQKFYSDVFAWQFAAGPADDESDMDYRMITTPGGTMPTGGLFGCASGTPNHAVFSVAVADVPATCELVTQHGGTVVSQAAAADNVPAYAYLRDPAGNLVGIFTPPTCD